MQPNYIYAGTFSPPTYGHWRIVCRMAEFLPKLTMLCSVNPNKNNNLFTPEECQKLWDAYTMPLNTCVKMLADIEGMANTSNIVLVRGIRGEKDLNEEGKVALYNRQVFGIDKYYYIISEDSYSHISSSYCRSLVQELRLDELSKCVAPLVVSALLEKELGAQNIFLVVGRPGSGKSTLLKFLAKLDPDMAHINTDDFNHALRPLLKQRFGEQDLTRLAVENEDALLAVIRDPWLKMLSDALRSCHAKNIFVEIPYAMQNNKRLYEVVGGKIIFVDGGENNKERLSLRGTPQQEAFIEKIPGWGETQSVCKRNCLSLIRVHTDGTLEETEKNAAKLHSLLNGGNLLWKMCSPSSSLDIW